MDVDVLFTGATVELGRYAEEFVYKSEDVVEL